MTKEGRTMDGNTGFAKLPREHQDREKWGGVTVLQPDIKGKMPLAIGGRVVAVYGGPYEAVRRLGVSRDTSVIPESAVVPTGRVFGVKLEERAQAPATLTYPIKDFSLPEDPRAFTKA